MTVANDAVSTQASPASGAKNGVAVTIWVDRSTADHVEVVSTALGMSRSALLNELITIGKSTRRYKDLLRSLTP